METFFSSRCVPLYCSTVTLAGLALEFPRRLMEDDVYKGQFIPAGATIIYNTWYATRRCVLLWQPVECRKGRCSITNRCILTRTSSILTDSSKTVRSIPT